MSSALPHSVEKIMRQFEQSITMRLEGCRETSATLRVSVHGESVCIEVETIDEEMGSPGMRAFDFINHRELAAFGEQVLYLAQQARTAAAEAQ